jgi:hypothetical protein
VDLYRLHPNQMRVQSEAARFNVVVCGRRWGKTILGIDLACDTGLDGGRAGWFAPEYKLLLEAWREMKDILGPVTRSCSDQEKRIELVTGGVIECWAFDRNANAGRSRKYHRVVIDEAAHCANLETSWSRAIRPTLTDYKGDAWFLSSPNGENYFHTLFKRDGRPGWRSWRMTSYDNPKLDPKEIDGARFDLGDLFFRQEYLAEFLTDSHDALLDRWWVERMADPGIVETCERLRQQGQGGRRIMAADLALGTGRDRTVILVRDRLGILDYHESSFTGIPAAAQVIAEKAREWAIDSEAIVYDAGGPGRDLPRYLEQHRIEATPYHGASTGGPRFKNRRGRVAWRLRQRLDPERPVELPPDPIDDGNPWVAPPQPAETKTQHPFACPAKWLNQNAREELIGLRYAMDGAKVVLENKDDFMARIGRSPDFADAALMLFSVED